MFKALLNVVVIVPVVLGVLTAKSRPSRSGPLRLLVFMLIYAVFYVLLLYYLQRRWVG